MSKKKLFNKKAFLIQGLRRMSYRFPPRSAALKAARVGRNQYKCNVCGKIVKSKEFAMDHVNPIVNPTDGFIDWNHYIEGMFCDESGWQLLCRIGDDSCNSKKTRAENLIRKEQRQLKRPPKVKKPKKVKK